MFALSLKDEDKLVLDDNTYNLQVLVHSVFIMIVISKDDKTLEQTIDLYTEYSNITIKQAAQSNLCLSSYFEQNCKLAYDFF